jgi:hypothetical protein
MTGLNDGLYVRTIEVAPHDPHPLAIPPIQLPALSLELELLWRERAPCGHDRRTVLPVEVRALDGTVVHRGNTHVRPIDVACRDIHSDAIGVPAFSDDDLLVEALGI